MIHEILTLSEYETALKSNKKVAFEIYTTQSESCKMILPYFEKLSESCENIYFMKSDADAASDVAEAVQDRGYPCFVLYEDGKKLTKFLGADPVRLTEIIGKLAGL
ncbi:hypothetical protein K3495_g13936 [Podosphaera aphanis]|nr:hypothetical protein K3495_g13936 [Podosphaera aphanis]